MKKKQIILNGFAKQQSRLYLLALLTIQSTIYAMENPQQINAANKNGRTALHFATKLGNEEDVQMLLAFKADVTLKDKRNKTALHYAAEKGRPASIRLLLEHGAEIEAKDYKGRTPLHIAAINSNFEAASILLEYKGAVDVLDNRNKTPLHHAAYNLDPKMVQLLLIGGANPHARSKDYKAPLDLACWAILRKMDHYFQMFRSVASTLFFFSPAPNQLLTLPLIDSAQLQDQAYDDREKIRFEVLTIATQLKFKRKTKKNTPNIARQLTIREIGE